MSGASYPLLGLIVEEGALAAYSIESRNLRTISNVRGHILLHPTDNGRNPDAFGGQQSLPLQPGEEYRLTWRIGWYPDRDSVLTATDPPARLDRYAAQTGSRSRSPAATAPGPQSPESLRAYTILRSATCGLQCCFTHPSLT